MNIDLKAPREWSEMTVGQFRMVMETLTMHLTEQEKLFMLLCRLTGIKMRGEPADDGSVGFVTSDGLAFRMQQYEVAYFSECMRWMVATTPDHVPNPTRLDDYLRDMTFGDWFETDTQFRVYDADHDPAHFDIILDKLGMADEPRPAGEAVIAMLRLWWHWVMKQIAPLYPNIFELREPGQEPVAYNPFRQLQDFHLMLNNDRPQDNDPIDEARLHDVLSALDNKVDRQKREAEALKRYV